MVKNPDCSHQIPVESHRILQLWVVMAIYIKSGHNWWHKPMGLYKNPILCFFFIFLFSTSNCFLMRLYHNSQQKIPTEIPWISTNFKKVWLLLLGFPLWNSIIGTLKMWLIDGEYMVNICLIPFSPLIPLWLRSQWSHNSLEASEAHRFSFAAHTNAVPVATSLKAADGATIWRATGWKKSWAVGWQSGWRWGTYQDSTEILYLCYAFFSWFKSRF